MEKHVTIQWRDLNLSAAIHYPPSYLEGGKSTYPVIIICHGFIGTKMGVNRLFVNASRELSQNEYVIVRFDYSGCGESEGYYGRNKIEDLIDQTVHVIDYVQTLPCIDRNNVLLIGHSLGGAVALLTAVKDERVRNLVLWSAVGTPYQDIMNIIGIENATEMDINKEVEFQGYLLRKEFFQSLQRYEPIKCAMRFKGNVLVVHGDEDEEIDVNHCIHYDASFSRRRVGSCEKRIIKGACHTYSSNIVFNELIKTTGEWVQKTPK
ncbi:S9 family peptidase [uncultured Rossellomorea sp.]|uniref:alpha/beta hydrolase family protein n=1 Tax=uncultured Rossellomorea sp. TaxID=2837549 RepID=UPI00261BBAC3|nr:alpha/beta fold hydrolase [uncultured Rossellomorea sp.]